MRHEKLSNAVEPGLTICQSPDCDLRMTSLTLFVTLYKLARNVLQNYRIDLRILVRRDAFAMAFAQTA
jgi:hypothetical protein